VDGALVANKVVGQGFGELALMHNSVRTATVVAAEDSEVWTIYRRQVRQVIADSTAKVIQENRQFINKVPSFGVLFESEKKKLAEVLTERSYEPGEDIVKQGEEGDTFYIVKNGEVQVTVKDEDGSVLPIVATYKKGDYFGELALVNKQKKLRL